MRTKNILLVLSLFFVIISLSNCAKKKENLLIGSWDNVPLTEEDTAHTEIWKFDAGGNFTYNKDSSEYTGSYTFISKTFNSFADITGVDKAMGKNYYFDGLYKIEKIDKDVLVLQCEEPYRHKEFTRKD